MAHFYGVVRGSARTSGTRCGSKAGGLLVRAMSWGGTVEVRCFHDAELKRDVAEIECTSPAGQHRVRLYYVMGDGAVLLSGEAAYIAWAHAEQKKVQAARKPKRRRKPGAKELEKAAAKWEEVSCE